MQMHLRLLHQVNTPIFTNTIAQTVYDNRQDLTNPISHVYEI